MGTWVRIDGKVDLSITDMFVRFNLSEYRYEHYDIIKQKIESIVKRSFDRNKLAWGLDSYCGVTFDDKCCYRSNYLYLYDIVYSDRQHYVTSYDTCTFYLNAWSRYGTYEQGQQFVENMIHSLKSNNCFVNWNTKIIVTADSVDDMSIYNGHKSMSITTEALNQY